MRLLPLLALVLAGCGSANVAVNRGFDFTKVRRVAVIRFSDYASRSGSGDIMTGAFEQALLTAGYSVVERAQVSRVLEEQRMKRGAIDAKSARSLGKALGVDALLMGQITDMQEPRERLVPVDVVDERQDPVYVRRTKNVTKSDGTPGTVEETVLQGYKTSRVVRQEPRSVTQDGRLGVAARMVDVASGELMWSGSDSTRALTFEDAARGLADSILRAVRPTWPASR